MSGYPSINWKHLLCKSPNVEPLLLFCYWGVPIDTLGKKKGKILHNFIFLLLLLLLKPERRIVLEIESRALITAELAGRKQIISIAFSSVQFSSLIQSCPTLCDSMNCSTPGLPVHHQLPEFTQTHVHWVSDAIQPSHPLSSPSPRLVRGKYMWKYFLTL